LSARIYLKTVRINLTGLLFAQLKFSFTFAVPKNRELSSAGSEHLPYKQRVGGSNPSAPTKPSNREGFFMNATFYILGSTMAGKFYVGHTTEHIDERLRKHNADHRGFTGKFRDWKLIFSESYPTKELAYAREREVKGWKSKKRIQLLIAGSGHPA
jgi:putative endonuclease